MSNRFAGPCWIVLAALLLPAPPALGQTPPSLSFDPEAVIAEGLPTGGEVAFFGVGREFADFLPHVLFVWEVVAVDATGTARLELDRPVPTTSVWSAVDLATGALVLAAPPGMALNEVAFPPAALPAALNRLDDARPSLAVLWVRPVGEGAESGAWGGAVSDGSARDGDGAQNRGLRVLLERLEPLAASPPPPAVLTAGDVLVAVDPDTLEVYAAQLAH